MTDDIDPERRTVLKSIGGVLAGAALAGCSGNSDGNGSPGENTVAVGPNNQFRFAPAEITTAVGETITWEFESAGHNVCAWPAMFDAISIPDGAEGFGSMPQGGNRYATVDNGGTYEHTFETAGEYRYVCGLHVNQGMLGTVIVE